MPPDEGADQPGAADREPAPPPRLALLAVSYGGLGLLPLAPGTWGTAGAAATAALVLVVWPGAAEHWQEVCAAFILLASVVTVALTPAIERSAGKDPQVVVTDEVAGYFATLILVAEPTLAHLAAAFFVFRLFDILKPWPGRRLELLPAGWGVLLDDVMAGLYGAVLLLAVDLVTR